MSNTNDQLSDLRDDDIIVVFRSPDGQGRRRASRATWAKIKQTVLASQPTVAGPQGPVGSKGDTGSIGAVGPVGPKGDRGSTGAQGPKGDIGPAGPKGDTGAPGAQGATGLKGDTGATGATGPQGVAGQLGATGATGPAGKDGAGIRVERFSATTNASGIATITFPTAFARVPDINVIEGWGTNDQMVTGAVIAGTATTAGCQVQVMLSRATLLLSTGPFQKAGSGASITVVAIGT